MVFLVVTHAMRGQIVKSKQSVRTHLKLAIGPSWDLNDHVQDGLLLVGIERDVVEWRDWLAILLDVDAVLQGVWGTDLTDRVLRSHVGVVCSGRIIF